MKIAFNLTVIYENNEIFHPTRFEGIEAIRAGRVRFDDVAEGVDGSVTLLISKPEGVEHE